MRVVLQIVGGPQEGNRLLLVPHQTMSVGRTERADLAIEHDARLSSVHFELSVNGVACTLRDLQSTNGTWLHGEPVEQAVLRNGDVIRAGQSEFLVQIEGGDPEAADARYGTVVDAGRSRAAALAAISVQTTYESEQTGTGLTRCFGASDAETAAVLAERLGQVVPMTLVVDVGAVDWPATELPAIEPEKSHVLYRWLPEAAQRMKSPLVLAAESYPLVNKLIQTLWGSNALLCFYSMLPPSDLTALLQKVMFRGRDYAPGRPIVGCCWPNVLGHLLSHDEWVSRTMFDRLDAALMEFPHEPERWQLVGRPAVTGYLEKIGVLKLHPGAASPPG